MKPTTMTNEEMAAEARLRAIRLDTDYRQWVQGTPQARQQCLVFDGYMNEQKVMLSRPTLRAFEKFLRRYVPEVFPESSWMRYRYRGTGITATDFNDCIAQSKHDVVVALEKFAASL